MSVCINNDLIWISIPRCASHSIERALLESNLNLKFYKDYTPSTLNGEHTHITLNKLYSFYGIKETICVKRDWFERWISGLKHMWFTLTFNGLTPLVSWDELDNDFIFKNITIEYCNLLHSVVDSDFQENTEAINFLNFKFSKTSPLEVKLNSQILIPNVLLSQNYWLNNNHCTYEFDINEIDKFKNFIYNRYGIYLKIEHLNHSSQPKNKIIMNEELRNWVWENFEDRFTKSKNLI